MAQRDVLYDVKVENAFKSYNETCVLQGLNMNVVTGSIYALLGPSGCGKTTILQCILGTMQLDSGYIDLKAEWIKDIGYMPQHLCLDETLTVKETFEFYGSIHSMSSAKINSRINELDKFLRFPDMNTYVKNISGGHSRRLSIGIALLHDPKIFILDEPTVGIDPVMRYEIWKEFAKMAEHYQKTIIITTHYIEEANQADCIGFMKNGIIAEEGPPQHILTKYETNSLEECFLKACYSKKTIETTNKSNDSTEVQGAPVKCDTNKIKLKNSVSACRLKALLKKHFRVCSRDYILLFTMVVVPIIQTLGLCTGIGKNFINLPIAIKNDEVDFKTCRHIYLDGCIFNENNNQTMSCTILNHLQSLNYNLFEVEDREDGETSINNGNSLAFLYFPKNFTREFINYVEHDENFDEKNVNYAHINKDNFMITNQMTKDLIDSFNYLMEKTLKDCSKNPKSNAVSLDYTIVYGHNVKSYTDSIVSTYLALTIFYFASMLTASIMLSEKMDGHFGRSIHAGVKIPEVVFAIFCVTTTVIVVQIFIVFVLSFKIFNHPITSKIDDLTLYFAILLILGWNGFFFGLIVAVMSPSQIIGIYVIIGMAMTHFFLSGAIWPLEGQPRFLYAMSEFLPVRLASKMMVDISLKDWTLNVPSFVFRMSTICSYITIIILVLIAIGKYKKGLWAIQK